MNITRLNLVLLIINLLAVGIFVGAGGAIGLNHHRQDHSPLPRPKFDPAFQKDLEAKILAVEPNWKQDIGLARQKLQHSLKAQPFDDEAFKQAAREFDRLMDEFHTVMRQQMHEHAVTLTDAERARMADMFEKMPLPLIDGDRDTMLPPPFFGDQRPLGGPPMGSPGSEEDNGADRAFGPK